MRYSIGETAGITGVTIRTLRYYDKIGLLKPAEISDAGYRYYTEKEIAVLQQVLFYRELEFSLEDIKGLLSAPEAIRRQALEKHRELLMMKRKHIDGLIKLAEETIGGKIMSRQNITADDIEKAKAKYAEEVRERWGGTKEFEQSENSFYGLSDSGKERLASEQDEIFSAFAACADKAPDSAEVQALVKRWQNFISENYYKCTAEILAELGQMYLSDERFKNYLDSYGNKTAQIMSEGIRAYCGG